MRVDYKATLLGIFLLSACSHTAAPPTLEDPVVTRIGFDQGGAFCHDFKLTNEQVSLFFKKALPMTAAKIHDQFNILPCYVRGHGHFQDTNAVWEIRAGGTGQISTGNGLTVLYGCPDCNHLLRPTQ